MPRSRYMLAALLGVTVLCAAREASAQESLQEPAPASAPAPVAAPADSGPAPLTAPPLEETGEEGRLRIGFNINGGVGTHAELSGPAFGTTFRLGYQATRLLGVYGNLSSVSWLGALDAGSTGGATPDVTPVWSGQLTPMLSLTPVDFLEIAAGPSLDYFTGGEVTTGGRTRSLAIISSVDVGAHGRVAFHLGGRNEATGHRRGFTIGGDFHSTFAEGGPVNFFTLGLGYDWH